MNTADFLVIGGGIAGVSAAAELSAHGQVILIEAEEALAYHSSGRSAALYEPGYGPPAILELSRASGQGLTDLGVLSPRGLMLVAAVGETEGFADLAAAMELSEIDIHQAMATCPALDPRIFGRAAYGGKAQDIDTDLLLQRLLRLARDNGAQTVLRAPVGQIRRVDGLWHLSTPKEDFRARVLINAAGAWGDRIAKMAGLQPLGLQPMRRSMVRIPAPGGHDVSGWPMLLGVRDSWYAKPDAGALIVSPCDADPVPPQDAWADDMVLAEGLARYEALMRFPVERVIANWAGLRTFTPDGTPAYGRDADQPDFVWFVGQGGYGFQSSVAAAGFLADCVLGRPTEPGLTALLDPARFRPAA